MNPHSDHHRDDSSNLPSLPIQGDRRRQAIADASRLARSLTTAVYLTRMPDPLNDPLVQQVLRDVRRTGSAGRVAVTLAATALCARDQLNLDLAGSGLPSVRLDDMERQMVGAGTLDADLVRDCFAVLRGMNDSDNSGCLREVVKQSIDTWGPYVLITHTYVLHRMARTLSRLRRTIRPLALMQQWALEDERFILTQLMD